MIEKTEWKVEAKKLDRASTKNSKIKQTAAAKKQMSELATEKLNELGGLKAKKIRDGREKKRKTKMAVVSM
jgi:hypothetical protein